MPNNLTIGISRIVRTRCFSYQGDYKTNKLDPTYLPCVFIGYSNKHKGYKCIYPLTGRIYILRHVVFDKLVLPYSKPTMLYDSLAIEGKISTFTEWEKPPQHSKESTKQPLPSTYAPPPLFFNQPEETSSSPNVSPIHK